MTTIKKHFNSFLTQRIKLIIALSSGILMGATVAPFEAWYLGWIAIAPLWYLVLNKPRFTNVFYGFVWGIGYHGLALFWITGIHPMTWMGVPWLTSLIIAIACLIFITLWGATIVVFWSIIMTFLTKNRPINPLMRIILGIGIWLGLEYIWSLGDLWWSSISFTQSPHNLLILHLGQISGPSIVTASLMAVNGLFAEGLIAMKKPFFTSKFLPKIPQHLIYFNSGLALLIILHLGGLFLYNQPIVDSDRQALKVGIVQGNIPNTIKLYRRGWEQSLENYTQGYAELADRGVDVVLTPEAALPQRFSNILQTSFYQEVLTKKVPVWLGVFGDAPNGYTQSLYTLMGDGQVYSQYDKVKLVPLGEYIPFKNILGNFINRLSPLNATLLHGSPNQQFNTPFGVAIAGICYDSAFGEHFRTQAKLGEFILTASNDAHYSPAMPAQHHAQDIMRAIETDRWAVRATNTGYSGIVDPHGRTKWISEINQYAIHSDVIYRQQSQTLYVRWGDWITPLFIFIGGIGYFFKNR